MVLSCCMRSSDSHPSRWTNNSLSAGNNFSSSNERPSNSCFHRKSKRQIATYIFQATCVLVSATAFSVPPFLRNHNIQLSRYQFGINCALYALATGILAIPLAIYYNQRKNLNDEGDYSLLTDNQV